MASTETILGSKNQLLKFKSLKTKLTVVIVITIIASGTALTGIAAFMASNALEESSISTLVAIGEDTSEKLWLVANMGKDTATILAIDPNIQSMLVHAGDGTLTVEEQLAVSDYLLDIVDSVSVIFDRINIIDNQGIIIASDYKDNIGKDDSHRDVVANHQRIAYIGEPYIGIGDTPRIPYARPVYDDNGLKIGLIYIALNFPEIDAHVFATRGLSTDSSNFLVGPDGKILSGIKGDYSPFLTKKFDLSIFPPGTNLAQAPGYYGYAEYIVKTPVPGTDWLVITTESVDAVIGPITTLVMTMAVSLLIVIVIGVFVAIFISYSFIRPILALKEAAEKLALGDIDIAITHTGMDEIGQLADSFRNSIENTKQRVDAVQNIAAGNVNFMLNVASENDVEGHALIQMKGTLNDMANSLQELAIRSAEGELSYHADATQFQGVYRELIETLNQAFDLIINPLHETMRLSTSYSSGDYSDRFDPGITVKGEFVSFKAALNQIGINSSDTLLKIRGGIYDISAGAAHSSGSIDDISNAVATLAEGSSRVSSLAERNSAGLDQVLTAMNDLANTVSEVAQRTASVSGLASQSSDLAHNGVKRAELAGKGMEEVMESASEIAKSISEMSSHMEEIGGIVDVISGIAEQTSLLALNAAIEAARAGDAGLGFAVVADEVKSLAQSSHTSAEHIGSIIGNLQKMTEVMTTDMEKAAEVVEFGSKAVYETITIFQQMNEAISDVSMNISEVAAASEEQAASVQEITASISEVQNMVQETTREAADSATAAEEISASLDQLKDTAGQSAQLAETIESQVDKFKIE